jgi:hypothetical protein
MRHDPRTTKISVTTGITPVTNADLISFMSDDDSFSVMPFNSHVLLDQEPQPLKGYRPAAEKIVSSLIANGGHHSMKRWR